MAGNVNEWVMDVYRPLSIQTTTNSALPWKRVRDRRLNAEGRPVDKYDYVVYNIDGVKSFLQVYEAEGNKVGAFTPEDVDLMGNLNQKVSDAEERMKAKRFEEAQTLMQDAMDLIVDSDAVAAADLRKGFSENIDALPGQIQMRKESVEENLSRTNYRVANNIDYLDGDRNSSFDFAAQSAEEDAMQDKRVYNYGGSTMISNRSRVYKGGGWDDRAYYLIPGTRRFLDERQSSASIGFRCAWTASAPPCRSRVNDDIPPQPPSVPLGGFLWPDVKP